MQFVIPHFIYLSAAIIALFSKGKIPALVNVIFSIFAFLFLILFKQPQVTYVFDFLGSDLIFFKADRTSLFMGYIFTFMSILVTLYCYHVKEKIHHVLSMLFIASSIGMVFAGDLISFYIFGEFMMIIATILISYKKDRDSLKTGFRYFVIHFLGSLCLLAGIMVNFAQTGNIELISIASGIPRFLILIGIGVNAAFLPFHIWLPSAYSKAPIEASLLLSVFTTKAAVYALSRIFPGADSVAYMGAAMALFGVIMALMQSDARKLLSYHVISQVGFMVAGVGLGTYLGVDGALYHAFNNILYKSLLFMCIGAVIYRTGKQDLSELGGFARNMPITTIACIVAALSISGVPLFNGYASKALLYEASYKSTLLLWTLKLASLGTFISFSKFTYYGFLRSKKSKVTEAPINMIIPMSIIAILCIVFGIYPKLVTNILPYYTDIAFYIPKKVFDALIFTLASSIIFFIGMNTLFKPHKTEVPIFSTSRNSPINSLSLGLNSLLQKARSLLPIHKNDFKLKRFSKNSKTYSTENSLLSYKDFGADYSLLLLVITIAVVLIYVVLS